MIEQIKSKLDLIAEYQSQRDIAMLEKQRLIDAVYTDELKSKISEIESEFAGKTEEVNSKIAILENEVKQDVINYGASVKGTLLHAVFAKGRVSWDTKQLDGLMIAIPELEKARKQGEPSVSIRSAK